MSMDQAPSRRDDHVVQLQFEPMSGGDVDQVAPRAE